MRNVSAESVEKEERENWNIYPTNGELFDIRRHGEI